ncbi:MAG: HlyC/CorC family transporter [Gammaproteobacteria bacterium]|nr:HlyC/CorC family transporter [Gammaproteobacteria bacterium]
MFSTATLVGWVIALVILSAFFSGSETALMRVNRYRLAARARSGHRGARLAARLLAKPDRLIGLILLGNNVVNIAATTLATVLAIRLGVQPAAVVFVLTPVILIFAELAPKTVAALRPESIAYPAAVIYYPLLWLCLPLVWIINAIANGLLALFGVSTEDESLTSLNSEELRLAVHEAGHLLPDTHQTMLLRVLDLDSITVEDIMVPRAEINGIDLDDPWQDIVTQIRTSPHTRLPVHRDDYETVEGVLHLRKVVPHLLRGDLDEDMLRSAMMPPYYLPEDTPLNKQLLNFQANHRRMGLVVDEYGDVQGIVTLVDLLAEIVGDLQDNPMQGLSIARDKGDGVYQVDGSANIRELNRSMHWKLPTGGAKTLNGLILEQLQTIPEPGALVKIHGYPMEIVHLRDNVIKTVNIRTRAKKTAHEIKHQNS